ncbi:Pentatricopeptide repeat [Macleaya cordata]|uniref:Pentatricopeptide repeat n=1 Tax=Macleaya cordata TaxID=56857 RepID=A0A200Q8S4_MACCD|nr:Pentatricopeptide repeat [Macleaya cordata]
MFAMVRSVHTFSLIKVCGVVSASSSSSTTSKTLIWFFRFTEVSNTTLENFQTRNCSFSSSSESSTKVESFDFLHQFSPSKKNNLLSSRLSVINPYERRQIVVCLSKLIKRGQGFLLKGFSLGFCPFVLVRIMKFFNDHRSALAFFKFAFEDDDSESSIRSCCIVAHLFAAQKLRYLSQDVLSCVVARIGSHRSRDLVDLMWSNHHMYESDFSVLDSLMRAFLNVNMVSNALEVLNRIREEKLRPSLSAVNILLKLLLQRGDFSIVWKLFRDMVGKGPHPSNYVFNVMGSMKSASNVFMDMHRTGLTPDIVTYNTLISGYCKAFDLSNAEDFATKMCASGWHPDITTYNIRMHGFCSSRKIKEAVKMLNELISLGVVPNTVTYNTMMNGVCSDILDRAMILTAKLLKMAFVPNVVTVNLLLSHFCRKGLPERALTWGHKLSQVSFPFDDITYKILERARCDILEDAEIAKETPGESIFLDFLMYITYDYIGRNNSYQDKDKLYFIRNMSSQFFGPCQVK